MDFIKAKHGIDFGEFKLKKGDVDSVGTDQSDDKDRNVRKKKIKDDSSIQKDDDDEIMIGSSNQQIIKLYNSYVNDYIGDEIKYG